MSKKKLTPEEELAAARVYRSALEGFGIGLKKAAEGYATGKWKDESAAVAVAATIGLIKKVSPQRHLLAPLYQALEIIERKIAKEDRTRLPAGRRGQAIVMNIDAYIGKPLPPIAEFKKPELSEDAATKVAGLVAVECQHRNGVLKKDAYRLVTGDDASADVLEEFRGSVFGKKKSPKHAEAYYREWLQAAIQRHGHDPELLAQETLRTYRNMLGQPFSKGRRESKNPHTR